MVMVLAISMGVLTDIFFALGVWLGTRCADMRCVRPRQRVIPRPHKRDLKVLKW